MTSRLYSTYGSEIQLCKPRREKLKCLLTYFKAVTAGQFFYVVNIYENHYNFTEQGSITGSVTIERVCVGEASFNRKSLHTILPKISIVESGSPLDCPTDATYVELSNRSNGEFLRRLKFTSRHHTDTLVEVFWAMAAGRRRSNLSRAPT
jgi:hypothetical protein